MLIVAKSKVIGRHFPAAHGDEAHEEPDIHAGRNESDRAVAEHVMGAAGMEAVDLVVVDAIRMARSGAAGPRGIEAVGDVFVVVIGPAAVGLTVDDREASRP